jgi:hypothetical protein
VRTEEKEIDIPRGQKNNLDYLEENLYVQIIIILDPLLVPIRKRHSKTSDDSDRKW